MRLQAVLLAASLAVLPGASCAPGRSRSAWWGIVHSGSVSNRLSPRGSEPLVPDTTLAAMTRRQRRLVRRNPGVLHGLLSAVRGAVRECRWQFRHRRWDCPSGPGPAIFGKILQRGCREAAFIHALASAAVVHSVARACSDGTVASCTCDYRRRGRGGPDWEWGGCSDNLPFGTRFSRDLSALSGSARNTRDLRVLMDQHNEEAGRKTVEAEMRQECKCHGMSGSCALKTCWLRLPHFRSLGDRLKERFDGATHVSNGGKGGNRASRSDRASLQPADPSHKTPAQRDLVYLVESPEFCEAEARLGWPGTRGRRCNSSSPGLDGCELLCCGRGWNSYRERVSERCLCTFHWCCTVTCQNCTRLETVHECL
uniref:proto-oncogene Wnt-1 n=1 Tax=Myxine glutinosa TaxID=7769 RepID=UPI00358E8906